MASSSSSAHFTWLASIGCVLALQFPQAASAADPPATTTPSFDARRALPLFPGNSWRDGYFVEHSGVSDFGFQVRTTGVYGRNPLGITDEEAQKYTKIENRFTLHLAAMISIASWVELGLAMPFVLYQDSSGFNLSRAAIGDLRIVGKVNLHLPDKSPIQAALSMGVGFQTAQIDSGLGAGQISVYPRLILDAPKLLSKRLHIAANVGAIVAGSSIPCAEGGTSAQPAQLINPLGTLDTPGTGSTVDPNTQPCTKLALGLGNHILYGAGISMAISQDNGLYINTELLGSFSLGLNEETRAPLFWDVGLRRSKSNGTYFAVAYGIGLTSGSPSHTVIAGLGLNWESKPPDKKKEGPSIRVDINLTGLPSGASAMIPSVDGPGIPIGGSVSSAGPDKGSGKPGDKPAAGGGAPSSGGGAAKTTQTTPTTTSADVPVPDGLIPPAPKKAK
ncbi:MAG TPA: hypothetical protein PKE31_01315 [Pseudomonadota bacterium]|nr:hypothetical protein [Pseudomonadota bacterium]